mmetsp:Transcript_3721/g.7813  ORF Transcript_3721/g.7813 Transcript_3721/m.7813 type:complete len:558 (+) Transcript_3721:13-1686(+)
MTEEPRSPASSEVVRPSSPLIRALHRRLCDPFIVPSFERRRPRSEFEGLVRPRWTLSSKSRQLSEEEEGAEAVAAAVAVSACADGNGAAAGDVKGDAGRGKKDDFDGGTFEYDGRGARVGRADDGRNATVLGDNLADENTVDTQRNTRGAKDSVDNRDEGSVEYNAIPSRNYIDLRMEQNKMFADDQCDKCQRRLSELVESSGEDKQWKKRADEIQSLVNEGLAACPSHKGLLDAEREYKAWIQQRIDSLRNTKPAAPATAAVKTAKTNGDAAFLPNPLNFSHAQKKGAEGRAHAAMRDALLERSFLLGQEGEPDGRGRQESEHPLVVAPVDEQSRGGRQERGDPTKRVAEEKDWRRGECTSGASSDGGGSGSRGRERRRSRRERRKSKKESKRSKKRRRKEDRRRKSSRWRRGDSSSPHGSRSRSGSMPSSHSSEPEASSESEATSYRRRKHRRRRDRKGRHEQRRRSRSGERTAPDDAGKSRTAATHSIASPVASSLPCRPLRCLAFPSVGGRSICDFPSSLRDVLSNRRRVSPHLRSPFGSEVEMPIRRTPLVA